MGYLVQKNLIFKATLDGVENWSCKMGGRTMEGFLASE